MRNKLDALRKSMRALWTKFLRGLPVLFALFSVIGTAYLALCGQIIDGWPSRIGVMILFAAIPMLLWLRPAGDVVIQRRVTWVLGVLSLFVGCTLVLTLIGVSVDSSLGLKLTGLLFACLPFSVVCWILMWNKPILLVPLLPSGILSTIYLHTQVSILPGTDWFDSLLTLPIVLIAIGLWTSLSWFLIQFSDSLKPCTIRGSGVESIAMIVLFAPIVLLGVWIPQELYGSAWSSALGMLISVILGIILAKPVGQFLTALRNR